MGTRRAHEQAEFHAQWAGLGGPGASRRGAGALTVTAVVGGPRNHLAAPGAVRSEQAVKADRTPGTRWMAASSALLRSGVPKVTLSGWKNPSIRRLLPGPSSTSCTCRATWSGHGQPPMPHVVRSLERLQCNAPDRLRNVGAPLGPKPELGGARARGARRASTPGRSATCPVRGSYGSVGSVAARRGRSSQDLELWREGASVRRNIDGSPASNRTTHVLCVSLAPAHGCPTAAFMQHWACPLASGGRPGFEPGAPRRWPSHPNVLGSFPASS